MWVSGEATFETIEWINGHYRQRKKKIVLLLPKALYVCGQNSWSFVSFVRLWVLQYQSLYCIHGISLCPSLQTRMCNCVFSWLIAVFSWPLCSVEVQGCNSSASFRLPLWNKSLFIIVRNIVTFEGNFVKNSATWSCYLRENTKAFHLFSDCWMLKSVQRKHI